MSRRTVKEEQTVAGQKIYLTPQGWYVDGLRTPPLERDVAVTLAELLNENRHLAQINAQIVEHGGKPIPPMRVSEEAVRRALPQSFPR